MATYRAVVEMTGRDPFGLRAACEEACNEWLLGEPAGLTTEEELDDLAENLRLRYLRTINSYTTAADGLAVTVRPC